MYGYRTGLPRGQTEATLYLAENGDAEGDDGGDVAQGTVLGEPKAFSGYAPLQETRGGGGGLSAQGPS